MIDEAIQMRLKGWSWIEIANALNISATTIRFKVLNEVTNEKII
jgi:orotate phosphoribosyltransferase-like protein